MLGISLGLENTETNGQNNDIYVIKSGTTYAVRTAWTDTVDLFSTWVYPKATDNFGLDMVGTFTCPKSQAYDNITGTSWKSSADDSCPIFANNSYVGGNHGWQNVDTITATGHNKSNEDIGSVWTINSTDYIIADVVNSNTLLVISDYQGSQTVPCKVLTDASGTLTHKSGATHDGDIIYSAKAASQIKPIYNKVSVFFLINGIPITSDGVYKGTSFNIIEKYTIIDIPSLQAFLKLSVGSSTKPNLADETIDGWIDVTNTYTHGRNGSMTVKQNLIFLKATTGGFNGVVQASPIGTKMYIPNMGTVSGLDLSTVVEQTASTAINFLKTDWLDTNKPPYRYLQFNDDLSSGIALGYNTAVGVCIPTTRKSILNAGYYSKAKKIYPYATHILTIAEGTEHEIVSYRVPLQIIDADVTAAYWYWYGNDIYFAIDVHKNIDKTIALPSYLCGKKIEQLDVHANTTINVNTIQYNGLPIKIVNNYGYAVLRLYN